ncbi:alanine--tRNA ligase-like [Cucumis melo var. makuwa]|uniref:alanine--tRNA ligase n=1 Tax=Cucumis melo var. makuwa TaxID=1194695 RepID=A0A5D3CG90_CUCMM|nr:alanine--tRNA ligase-like [Cucumis melo var. makuwa]
MCSFGFIEDQICFYGITVCTCSGMCQFKGEGKGRGKVESDREGSVTCHMGTQFCFRSPTRVNSSPCYHRRQLLPLPHRARASRGTLTLLTTGTLPARDVRFLILEYLKVPLVHFKYAMFKYLEVSSYILAHLMVEAAEFLWVTKLFVDYERRTLIAPNHTCTHMLNFALREILGNHVDQKGSIVLPEKLRFDFSHRKPVDPDDLRKIESIVNKQIEDELDVNAKEVTLAEAKRINGLRAVFGEVRCTVFLYV